MEGCFTREGVRPLQPAPPEDGLSPRLGLREGLPEGCETVSPGLLIPSRKTMEKPRAWNGTKLPHHTTAKTAPQPGVGRAAQAKSTCRRGSQHVSFYRQPPKESARRGPHSGLEHSTSTCRSPPETHSRSSRPEHKMFSAGKPLRCAICAGAHVCGAVAGPLPSARRRRTRQPVPD